MKRLNAVSIFTGGGGLDIGFKAAGFEIVLATDNWGLALDTSRFMTQIYNFA